MEHLTPAELGWDRENQPCDETGRQGEAGILSVAGTKLLPVEAGGGREIVAGSRVTAGVGN